MKNVLTLRLSTKIQSWYLIWFSIFGEQCYRDKRNIRIVVSSNFRSLRYGLNYHVERVAISVWPRSSDVTELQRIKSCTLKYHQWKSCIRKKTAGQKPMEVDTSLAPEKMEVDESSVEKTDTWSNSKEDEH